MDWSSVIGIIFAWVTVMIGAAWEGVHLASLIQFGTFIMIFGSSMGASLGGMTFQELKTVPTALKIIVKEGAKPSAKMVQTFVTFSEKARREGLLALEDDLEDIDDSFLKKGLQLVIDGADADVIKDILMKDIQSKASEENNAANFWTMMGGYSPTIGIIGTVIGLMHVLQGLGSADAQTLGAGIAMAFIATFYGIALANLAWLPLSEKLKYRAKQAKAYRSLILTGILTIQSGDNPRIVQDRLIVFISDESEKKKILEASAE